MDPTVAAVVAANQAFYAAHEGRDLVAMQAVWEHSDRAVCIHPGWPVLRTWPLIERSWASIFGGSGRNQFILTNQVIGIEGDLAWVTLEENLVDTGATGTVAATNMFARTGGEWRMIIHHGSPIVGH